MKGIWPEAFSQAAWTKLTIPESVEFIGMEAFDQEVSDAKHSQVTLLGNPERYHSMMCSSDTTYFFRKNTKDFFTSLSGEIAWEKNLDEEGKNVQYRAECQWAAVEGADGYEVQLQTENEAGFATDRSQPEESVIVKDCSKLETGAAIFFSAEYRDYYYCGLRVTPYTIKNGKKEYGRTTPIQIWFEEPVECE